MAYSNRCKRITIPLEKRIHIKYAAQYFKELSDAFNKIYKSPNSETAALCIADMYARDTHVNLKAKANAEIGAKEDWHYKNTK
tara:strand:- start:588 stop:836 length:249 start_codon:yes stop_codon:yes gene_type:complete